MTTDLTALSDSELRQGRETYDREAARRAGLLETERAQRFQAELQEVRDGKRAMADEHVAYLSPREVEQAVNRGQARHLGIEADRRQARQR